MTTDSRLPWPTKPMAWVAVVIACFGVIVAVALSPTAFTAQATLLVALCYALVAIITSRKVMPARTGLILIVGLSLWTVAHISEMISVARNPGVKPFGPLDLIALSAGFVMVGAGYLLWRRSATVLDPEVTMRAGLDGALAVLAVIVVFWHTAIAAIDPAHADLIGSITATLFTAITAAICAPLLTRALYRREAGSWLLFAAVSVVLVGVAIWATGRVGPDLPVIGTPLQAIGVFLLPGALTHPGHGRLVVLREFVKRDTSPALIGLLLAWAIAMGARFGQPMSEGTYALMLLSLAFVFLRIRMVGHSEDRLLSRLEVLAFTDPLTGVGNRRSLVSQLAVQGSGWLLTVDLDEFKSINDRFGHETGDRVLLGVTGRIKAVLPRGSHLARLGGDEFAIVLTGDRAFAESVASTVIEAARDAGYPDLSASVGVAAHEAGREPADTMRDSDIALQDAKRSGKNCYRVLVEDLRQQRLRELLVADRLRKAIERVTVAYQPIVATTSGNTVVVEALARWRDDELGEVSPMEFIGISERNGLIIDLGLAIFDQVLAQLRVWRDADLAVQVSVNVSLLQLCDSEAVATLVERVKANPDLARWLIIEVTETVLATDDRTVKAVTRLRELGVLIAVDDFGTGASTVTRLLDLPVDVLKLDRSLLRDASHDRNVQAVLETVLNLGRSLGLSVVAEGVEDTATADVLSGLGFALVQGFLTGRPGPAEDLLLLQADHPHVPARQDGPVKAPKVG